MNWALSSCYTLLLFAVYFHIGLKRSDNLELEWMTRFLVINVFTLVRTNCQSFCCVTIKYKQNYNKITMSKYSGDWVIN